MSIVFEIGAFAAWALIILQLIRIERNQKHMALDLTKLTADVAALTSVDESAITLLQGLKAEVDAIPTGDPAATQAAIDDLSAKIEAGSAGLAAAIVANTPSSQANPAAPAA